MDKLDVYAQIVLTSGLNLKKGQCVRINCGGENYPFARIMGQEAYKLSAKYVHISINDSHLTLSRLENQEGDDLEFIPEYEINFGREMLKDD